MVSSCSAFDDREIGSGQITSRAGFVVVGMEGKPPGGITNWGDDQGRKRLAENGHLEDDIHWGSQILDFQLFKTQVRFDPIPCPIVKREIVYMQ